MKRFTRTLVPVAALSIALACGDSTGVGVEPDDLAGTWTATSFVFASVADPTTSADMLALGGGLTLSIESSGAITVTTTVPGGAQETETGTLSVDGSNITIDQGPGDVVSGTITRDGDRITIQLTSGVTFDFDDDGTDEPATVTAVLQRS